MIDKRLLSNFHWTLLITVFFILSIGIINLYSATSESGIYVKQIYWIIFGIITMSIMLTFDYITLEKYAYAIYGISILLLIFAIIFGKVYSGAQRWIHIGPISIQPSEITKLSLIIALAKYFNKDKNIEYSSKNLFIPLIITSIPFIIVAKQPDLGTAGVLLLISFSIILFMKVKIRYILPFILIALFLSPIFWQSLKDYQKQRILTFINPNRDPLRTGYHITQSKIAIGSGKLLGKGFLKGTQSQLHFIPEHHTDFIFSVFAEEWGFLGAVVILSAYFILIILGLNIAKHSRERFGMILAFGITVMITWHVIINIGMVIGLLPVVGITLPLMSYGGSSILVTLTGIGILFNIGMRRFIFKK
jgi:rod shape determining protein RodA